MLWSWSTHLVLIGLTDLPNLEGGELPAPLVPTALQDRKKRKILVAQQKGSMVNLSPSINYSCSQVTPFSLCLFLVSKVSRILFVLEICLVVQKFITYLSNLASTFVIHDHWMTNDAYRLFRLRLIFGLIVKGTRIKFLLSEHCCEETIKKIGK